MFALVIASLIFLQLTRVANQKKLDFVFTQARQQLKLPADQKISGCKYDDGWYIVKASGQLWLYKNQQIYFADLGKYLTTEIKNQWPDLELQPADSPLIDFYYLYENCIW